MNRLLSLIACLILSTYVNAQDNSIYLKTDGDSFRFEQYEWTEVNAAIQKKSPKLAEATLAAAQFAAVFQLLKKPGCHIVAQNGLLDFSPYDDHAHFTRYYGALRLDEASMAILQKKKLKPKTLAIYNKSTGTVCSTGRKVDGAFFHQQKSTLYFTKCNKKTCVVSQITGLSRQTQADEAFSFEGEVVDMGYDNQLDELVVLVRKFKGQDGFFGRLFAKAGHGREKYDLYIYRFNSKTDKHTANQVKKSVVNPTFWLEQPWLL